MISINNISKSFAGNHVLKNVSVEFLESKINLIIGQSGSGKSVLLKSIVGLHTVDNGEIIIDDQVFNKLPLRKKRDIRKNMGMLFQGGALFDFLTVEENIRFPLDMYTNMSESEKNDRIEECIKRVRLVNSNKRYPSELSGGMQKRTALARAIVLNPSYLFCDEPTSGLDPMTAIVIDNLIREITEAYKMTTIINTHDMNSVIEMGEKVIFIHKGEKWWEGTKTDVFESDNNELNEFIFASRLAKGYREYERTIHKT